MAPLSPTIFDRLSLTRRGPVLPLHESRNTRAPSSYDLDELEPRPTDGLLTTETPELTRRRKPRIEPRQRTTEMPPDVRSEEEFFAPTQALFTGPPPPIARSVWMKGQGNHGRAKSPANSDLPPSKQIATSLLNLGSVLFDNRERHSELLTRPASDSVWQNLRRREKAVEKDLQHALDMQTDALLGGTRPQRSNASTSDFENTSDGGSSTPTGTFYSTASSKSRMARSLNPPIQSTPDGNVIPVRQPRRSKRGGIRAARQSLQRSMSALAELKVEEDACIAAAISERKMALAHARKLASRQQRLTTELQALEEDEEEPLGRELRGLHSQQTSLTTEIKELEERLVRLRNKKRWVDDRIDDVQNRREAGLSGYKGALREMQSDVASLMSHPPVAPLDRELWARRDQSQGNEQSVLHSPGGEEFLRLIPERRTLEMARLWWESELQLLESRREQVVREREALESGERMWQEVTELVISYETGLQSMVLEDTTAQGKGKGKGKMPNHQDMANQILSQMAPVITGLDTRLREAEDKQWNLLICAIGAELDTFREAEKVLQASTRSAAKDTLIDQAPHESDADVSSVRTESPVFKPSLATLDTTVGEDSDNEVPQDLLTSPTEAQHNTPRARSPSVEQPPPFDRSDSENSVPQEYLADIGGSLGS